MSILSDERVFDDDAARIALGALSGPYLPWGSGAMRPAGLVLVCNDIVLNGRRRIVELGSGISTVLLGRLLAQHPPPGGARMAAVEHDAGWARWVRGQLDREGIGDDIVVLHAPLVPRHDGTESGPWYDHDVVTAGLDAALDGEAIDLLIVDGPPAHVPGHGLARGPALPALRARLASGATVVLDDIGRPGEQAVLQRWETDTGVVFERHERVAGVAIATVT